MYLSSLHRENETEFTATFLLRYYQKLLRLFNKGEIMYFFVSDILLENVWSTTITNQLKPVPNQNCPLKTFCVFLLFFWYGIVLSVGFFGQLNPLIILSEDKKKIIRGKNIYF